MVNNPCIIVQARMSSTRLPGKVMRRVSGRPLIDILLERLKKSDIPILLATSNDEKNNPLVEFVKNKGIRVYRGSENNVLKRYYEAAKTCNCNTIIRATGDNPLMDGNLIKDAYQYYLNHSNERSFLSIGLSKTYPLGISISIFSFKLLEEAFLNAKLPGEFEHVTPYMSNNMPGNINIIAYKGNMNKYHYRLTVDTISDFELHKKLIEDYNCDNMSINEIIKVIDSHPELANINGMIVQRNWDERT